eukprot:INCI87.1.p1 GENE.INCI87.1~~INCI87.1.p1  ORF type:complete len:1009 (-),score=143.18 INCI87.1:1061-4060(-)
MATAPKRIRLKCHFLSDIRVVRLNNDTSFDSLVTRLNNDYGFPVALKYQDSEGDMIQLETQNDLDELLQETSTHSVKVFISESTISNSTPQSATRTPTNTEAGGSGGSAASGSGAAGSGPVNGRRSGPKAHKAKPTGKPSRAKDAKKNDIIDQALSSLARRGNGSSLASRGPGSHKMLQSPWRWQRGEILGQGAFGTVYLGLNLNSGELMAVKQLDSNEVTKKELMLLEHEVAMMRNLDHENITRYLGTDRTEDTLSIFLEYVPGGSIHSLLSRFGRFEETLTRTYTRQLLLGLEYLHRNGIAHRDIKGANILVANDGTVKLADFGASKSVGHKSLTATGIKGTPMWMAPEVIKQQKTVTGWKKADIWSVGCTVIEMITGKPPWSQYSNPVTAMYHIACENEIPTIPDIISPQGRAFLLMALRRDPDVRPDATSLLLNPFVAFVEQWCVRSKDMDILERPNTSGGLNSERDSRSRQRGRGPSRRGENRMYREAHSRQSSKPTSNAGSGPGSGNGSAAASGSVAGAGVESSILNSSNTIQASFRPDVSIDFSESVTDSELAAYMQSVAASSNVAGDFRFSPPDGLGTAPGSSGLNIEDSAVVHPDWEDSPDGLLTDGSYESRSPMAHDDDVIGRSSEQSIEESMEFDDSYEIDEFASSPQHDSPTNHVAPHAQHQHRGGSHQHHHEDPRHTPGRHGNALFPAGTGLDLEESHDSIDSALQSSTDEVRLTIAAVRQAQIDGVEPGRMRNGGARPFVGRRGDSGVKLSPMYGSQPAPLHGAMGTFSSQLATHGLRGMASHGQAVVLPPSAAHVAPVRAGTTQPQKKRDPVLAKLSEPTHARAQSSAGVLRPSKLVVGGRNYSNKSARHARLHTDIIGPGHHQRQMSPVSLDFKQKGSNLNVDSASGPSADRPTERTGSPAMHTAKTADSFASLQAVNRGGDGGGNGAGTVSTSAASPPDTPSRSSFSTDPRFSLMVGGSATGIRVQSRRANEIRKATFYEHR